MAKKFAETGPDDEREWDAVAGGWKTVAKCPENGSPVVYNGNYFCSDWGRGCNWALSGDYPLTRPSEIAICHQLGINPKSGGLLNRHSKENN